MPSDGRYMYPHPPPNMSYDYGAYPPTTYDNSQYPPNHPGAPPRHPHHVSTQPLALSRVLIPFHARTFPSRHTCHITVLPITSCNNNNGKQVGHRILHPCTTPLLLDSRLLSPRYPGLSNRRLRPHGTNPSNLSFSLRNPRTQNSSHRKVKCK